MTHPNCHTPLFLAMLACHSVAWAEAENTLASVTVTGAAEDSIEERRSSTTQKTVVSRKEIEALGGLTVGEVMGKLPGIDAGASGSDGNAAMRARGMMRDSVQILVDGERMGVNSRTALSMVGRLPSSELERVEILRGSSAEFGGAAPVTINLVMRKALSKDSLSLKAAAGVRGDKTTGQFTLTKGGGDKQFSWLLPLTLNHHETPSEGDTERQDFASGTRTRWELDHNEGDRGFNEHVSSPRFTWKQGADTFTLWPTVFYGKGESDSDMTRQTYVSPATGTGLAADGRRHDQEENRRLMLRLRGEGEMVLNNAKLSGRMAISKGRQETDSLRDSYSVSNALTTFTENLDREEQEGNVSLRLDQAFGNHLLAGSMEFVSLQREDDQAVSGSATQYQTRERQWTAWVQDEWNLGKGVVLTGGLRGESMRLKVDGTSRDFSRLLPSLAIRWEPGKEWVFRSSLGVGIKTPRLDELTDLPVTNVSANSPLEADRRGNPGLLPERSLNFEAVLERYLDNNTGVLGANVYWRATDDFVERRVALEGARWVDRPQNEGDAIHYGLELDAKMRTDRWGLKGGTSRAHLTLPRSRVKDARLGLTRSARETPTYQFTLGHDQNLASWKGSVGFQVQLFGRVKSDVPGEQWTRTGARTLLELYALKRINANLNLRVNLQNVMGADTEKDEAAWNGTDAWLLGNDNLGTRSLLVSLEGKW